MALTATATKEKYEAVCLRLSMSNPIIVGCSSYRANISYIVKPLPKKESFCKSLASDLKVLSAEFYFHKPITVHLELYLFYCFIHFLLYIGQY